MSRIRLTLYWAARIVAALIMFQTLYFKFTGASESVEIFTIVGMEPWGRFAVGILELVASILLLINATAWMGAALGAGLMAGAIGMHLTILGIPIQNDGGYLFFLAVAVFFCSLYILFVNKQRIMQLVSSFR
jgi:putative oxidoreductase